jgi:hypothetical protein
LKAWAVEVTCGVQTQGKRNGATPIKPKYGFIVFRKKQKPPLIAEL